MQRKGRAQSLKKEDWSDFKICTVKTRISLQQHIKFHSLGFFSKEIITSNLIWFITSMEAKQSNICNICLSQTTSCSIFIKQL